MPQIQGFAVAGKAWVSLVGSLLTFIIPWVVANADVLPPPWPSIIAAIVALLTAFGVYQAPYKPVPQKGASSSTPTPWPTD